MKLIAEQLKESEMHGIGKCDCETPKSSRGILSHISYPLHSRHLNQKRKQPQNQKFNPFLWPSPASNKQPNPWFRSFPNRASWLQIHSAQASPIQPSKFDNASSKTKQWNSISWAYKLCYVHCPKRIKWYQYYNNKFIAENGSSMV